MSDILLRVVAPHFVAGFIVCGRKVVHAAPIIHWAVGGSVARVLSYFRYKGYEVEVVG